MPGAIAWVGRAPRPSAWSRAVRALSVSLLSRHPLPAKLTTDPLECQPAPVARLQRSRQELPPVPCRAPPPSAQRGVRPREVLSAEIPLVDARALADGRQLLLGHSCGARACAGARADAPRPVVRSDMGDHVHKGTQLAARLSVIAIHDETAVLISVVPDLATAPMIVEV